jgi:cysteine sulfinate desulfinase/cysteine desulfurase-like protein
VPLDRIAESMTSRTTLVAVSAVQSADGRVADLDALHAASAATGARVLLDTTQATGDSAIVSLAAHGAAADAMAAARITGSARAGRLRLSFHVSTSDEDADLAANVLRRHVISRRSARP